MSQNAAATYPAKVANACTSCRKRKVKCSGEVRCKNCVNHDKECTYPPSQRRRISRAPEEDTISLGRRLMQVEALLHNSHAPEMSLRFSGATVGVGQNIQHQHTMDYDGMSMSQAEHGLDSGHPLSSASLDFTSRMSEKSPTSLDMQAQKRSQSLHDTLTGASGSELIESAKDQPQSSIPSGDLDRPTIDKEDSVVSPENVNWEHHGPGSWLSICSSAGVKWVAEWTGVPDFAESAKGLSMGWTKHLKLQRSMKRDRAPEPDPTTAWQYSRAHFEDAHYAVFDVVNRAEFETRLQFQQSQELSFEEDPSWYALRNTVYASGCIILMSRDPTVTFAEAQECAWRYFENALSVHTDLLYTPTGILAVEALTLMSYYAEGLGSPALEYMLCSSAARLAQSKGLHRQAAKMWHVPEAEALRRNWLFWAIYCCEKAIINRSSRPSAIDDDDISCQIPTKIPPGSAIDIDIFTSTIKHAQIASQISKQLLSVSAFRNSTGNMLKTVRSLDQKLQEWKDGLPTDLQISATAVPLHRHIPRNAVSVYQLQFAYHGSLMAIHMIMVYPWISAIFSTDDVQAFREQASVSSEKMAQAARSIILMTRRLNIDAVSPGWLAFYYPMLGLINLFILILKSPASPTASSDVALLDIAAGHFAHMEFMTSSELAFPFTREVADLARHTVKRVRDQHLIHINDEASWNDRIWANASVDYWNNLNSMGTADLDIEGWNTF